MARDTTRDRIWNAALEYRTEWLDKRPLDRRWRYGFTPAELIDAKELEASQKTVSHTLMTMADMGWFVRKGGSGGKPMVFVKPGTEVARKMAESVRRAQNPS